VPTAPAHNVIAKPAMVYRPRDAKCHAEPAAPVVPVAHALCFQEKEAVAQPVVKTRRVRQRVVCARCGRDSHSASSCFAHKHFTGAELRPRQKE